MCKSATLEQTNSAELSGPSEAHKTYHWLHGAELTVSGLGVMAAHNIQPEYPPGRMGPSCNEKIKFHFFFFSFFRGVMCEEYFCEKIRDERQYLKKIIGRTNTPPASEVLMLMIIIFLTLNLIYWWSGRS